MTDKKPENNKDKEKNQNKEEYKPLMELKVVESLQEDIDKGIARIPSKIMNDLDIVSGDIIEIKGKNKGIVKAMRSIKSDEGREIIRLDGTIRSNVGVSIGDKISVAKTEIKEAKKVTLSPLQEVRFSDDPTEYFHLKLLHYPINLNQKVVIDVFGNRLGYVITNISPKGKVVVTPLTKIVVSDEKYTGQ